MKNVLVFLNQKYQKLQVEKKLKKKKKIVLLKIILKKH